MPKYIKRPDGTYSEVPDRMSFEEAQQLIRHSATSPGSEDIKSTLGRDYQAAKDFLEGGYQNIAGAGDAVANMQRNVLRTLTGGAINLPHVMSGRPGADYESGKFLGDVGAFVGTQALLANPLFRALKVARDLQKGKKVGDVLSFLAKEESPLIRRAIGTGAYEGVTSDKDRLEKSLLGAGSSAVTDMALNALSPAIGRLPSEYKARIAQQVKDRLGPNFQSILRQRLRATRGTQTPLSRILENPLGVQRFEQFAAQHPFSGAQAAKDKTATQIREKTKNVFENWLEHPEHGYVAPHEIPSVLASDIKEAAKKHETETQKIYKEANDLGSRLGIQYDLPRTQSEMSKLGDEKLRHIRDAIDYYKPFQKRLDKLSDLFVKTEKIENEPKILLPTSKLSLDKGVIKQPVEKEIRKTFSNEDLGLVHLKRLGNELYTMGEKAKSVGKDPYPFFRMSRAIRSDVKDTIQSAPKEYQESVKKADEYYKKHMAPFRDKDIKKVLSGQTKPSEITDKFIKKGKNKDQIEDLEKLKRVLPDKTWNLLKADFFGNKMGAYRTAENAQFLESHPTYLADAINKQLGTLQKKAIFNPRELSNIHHLTELIGLNRHSLTKGALKGADIATGASRREPAKIGKISSALSSLVATPEKVAAKLADLGINLGMARLIANRELSEKNREQLIKYILGQKSRSVPFKQTSLGRLSKNVLAGSLFEGLDQSR